MMQTAAIFDWLRHFSPLRLAGPLSDKELRVASRRARSYMLRSGYVLLLCVLVRSRWYSMVGIQRVKTTAFGVSRAAEMATYLTSTIIWFQFATAQFIAAMVLSFSMSDELRRGTLSTLMTTPIRSVHIVAGKLLGGLLQVVLLLAIGLPVLAILRVQGGVQWSSVAAGFCVTVTAAYLGFLVQLLRRLGGPIFDKELRVTSRRIRYYALRTGYATALTFLIMVTWSSTVRTGSAVVLASRMPEVAKTVTTAVTWLQFLAGQGLAVVLLSSAIGEEIRKGTLSALLTTPITSFQIVFGKLLSRMLQVLGLLAMSLPVLAILRLLGGVPWEYVLAGGCLTLTTTLFVGALSLWLSTHCRYGSQAMSTALLILFVLFIIPPFVLSWSGSKQMLNMAVAASIMGLTDPFYVLYQTTADLWSPAGLAGAAVPWVINSLIMLGLALVLLALTIRRVRTAAVASMSGERKSAGAVVSRAIKRLLWNAGKTAKAAGPVRRVKGSPVVWKETRRGLLYGWSLSDIVICVIALAAVLAILIATRILDVSGAEPAIGMGLFLTWFLSVLVLVRLVVECAGNVPREREARTWPILLTTLLEDREIVNGKAKAALLRNAPLLITLATVSLLLLAVFPRAETLLAAGWALMSLVASVLLVMGIGSYFGLTIKTRASAVVTTIVVCLMVKYGIAWMFACVGVPLAAGIGAGEAAWGFFGFCIAMVIPAVIHVTIGVAAIRVAAQRVRHDVF